LTLTLGLADPLLKSAPNPVREPKMVSISAQEIKRRGISAVDEALRNGPVHIIKNNRPRYVMLTEATSGKSRCLAC